MMHSFSYRLAFMIVLFDPILINAKPLQGVTRLEIEESSLTSSVDENSTESTTNSGYFPWNTLTICTIIATGTFLIVWIIFWLIFYTEAAEFEKAQSIHTRNGKLIGRRLNDSANDNEQRQQLKTETKSDKAKIVSFKKLKSNKKSIQKPKQTGGHGHSIALLPLPRILENNHFNATETEEFIIVESCDDVAVQCEDEHEHEMDGCCDCETKNVDNLSNINLYQSSTFSSTGTGTMSQRLLQVDGSGSYETIPTHSFD